MLEMSAMLTLVADAVVALMLGVTIFFCFKLNRRIVVLQDSKGDMAQLIRKFDETTARASESIADLQKVSGKLQEEVSEHIQKANFVADDLAFMIDRGKKVANSIKQSSAPAAPTAEPARTDRRATPPRAAAPSVNAESGEMNQAPNQPFEPARTATTPPATGRVSAVRQRSKAEEELLAALRSTPES